MRKSLLVPMAVAAALLGLPAARGEPDPAARGIDGCALRTETRICARIVDLDRTIAREFRLGPAAADDLSPSAGSVLALPARPGGALGSAFPDAATAVAGPTEARGPALGTGSPAGARGARAAGAPVDPPRALAVAILALALAAAAAGIALSRRARRT